MLVIVILLASGIYILLSKEIPIDLQKSKERYILKLSKQEEGGSYTEVAEIRDK
jgi:hypothetical protein